MPVSVRIGDPCPLDDACPSLLSAATTLELEIRFAVIIDKITDVYFIITLLVQ
jgi:hypothetical protein